MEYSGVHCRTDFDDSAEGGFIAPSAKSNGQEVTAASSPTCHNTAPVIAESLEDSISSLEEAVTMDQGELSEEDLEKDIDRIYELKMRLENAELLRRGTLVKLRLASQDGIIETLTDLEAPNFGKKFLKRVADADIKFDIAYSGLTMPAVYTAYSLAEENRGFPNIMRFSPDRARNTYDLFLSSTHERGHGVENHLVDAMKCSPFNPDSKAVIHPIHWARLELACERETIADTVFMASKMAPHMPGLREHMRDAGASCMISIDEFEEIREKAPSLMDAMVTAALKALSKSPRDGVTYEDTYTETALEHVSAGLYWRREFKLGEVTFVRLTDRDIHSVGAHGIIPNPMGERIMEPLLLRELTFNDRNQDTLDIICKKYNIPNLYDCPTLAEYRASEAGLTAREPEQHLQMAAGGHGHHLQMA